MNSSSPTKRIVVSINVWWLLLQEKEIEKEKLTREST